MLRVTLEHYHNDSTHYFRALVCGAGGHYCPTFIRSVRTLQLRPAAGHAWCTTERKGQGEAADACGSLSWMVRTVRLLRWLLPSDI